MKREESFDFIIDSFVSGAESGGAGGMSTRMGIHPSVGARGKFTGTHTIERKPIISRWFQVEDVNGNYGDGMGTNAMA